MKMFTRSLAVVVAMLTFCYSIGCPYEEPKVLEKRYLIVSPQGSFESQLQVLASSYVMSLSSGRALVLDWESDLFVNSFDRFADIGLSPGREFNQPSKIHLDASPTVYVKTSQSFVPEGMSLELYQMICRYFFQQLKPSPEFKDQFQEFHTKFLAHSLTDEFGDFDTKRGKRYLVVNPMSGLANRMRSLVSAAVMAAVSGRTLIVDWQSQQSETPVNSFNDLFENHVLSMDDIEASNHPSIVKTYESDGSAQVNRAYVDFPGISRDTDQVVYLKSWNNFKPIGMPFDLYMTLYRHFYKKLRPIPSVASRVKNFAQQHFGGSQIVGVHYRSFVLCGDAYCGAPLRLRESFASKMQEHLAHHPNTKFFIAADDREVIHYFTQQFGQNQILSYPHSKVDRATLQDSQNSLVDWFLLGQTEFIIGTYQSSFSEEAALQTKTGKKINIGAAQFNFHSIYCFDKAGDVFLRPQTYNDPDECLKAVYLIT